MKTTFTNQELQNYKEVKKLYRIIQNEITYKYKYEVGMARVNSAKVNNAISKEVNNRGYDYKSWQATALKIVKLNEEDRKKVKKALDNI